MTDIQPLPLRYSLIESGVTYILPHAPTGWEDSLKNWSRNEFYFGMMRSFTANMEFALDGAWLLRRAYYTRGLRAEMTLVVEELQPLTWEYRESFRGSIDFSTFSDGKNTVSISAMEQGITEMVKAYEDVQYEIPLNVANAIDIRVPGIGLTERVASIIDAVSHQIRSEFYNILGIDIVINDLDSMFVTAQSVEHDNNFGGNQFPINEESWHIRGEADTKVSISVRLKGNYTLSRPDQAIHIMIISSEGGPTGTILFTYAPPLVGVSAGAGTTGADRIPFDIEFNFNHEISTGEKLFLAARGVLPNNNVEFLRIEEGDIRVSNSLITEPTLVKALRPFDLFKELLYRMNNYTAVAAQSFLLQGANWSRMVITSGDAIRGIADPKIRTTFKEFFQSMNGIIDVGFGMENGKAVLEEKPYWMKSGLKAFSVGEVKECVIVPATNFIYNSIKVGYPDKEYEREQGREEVNSTQQWSTPVTRVQKSLDLISPYRADQLGIEELRTLPSEQNDNQTDKESDNDTFVIKIQATPGEDDIYDVEDGRDIYTEIYGFESRQSYYNLDLTPKKNLRRHGSYLRGMLHRYEGRIIRFESAEKNANVRTVDLAGNVVQENVSISISNLPAAFFLPYEATIKFNVPRDAGQILDTVPTGYMEWQWLGDVYSGFFLEAKQDVARNSEQEWKVLFTAKNVMEKLIR